MGLDHDWIGRSLYYTEKIQKMHGIYVLGGKTHSNCHYGELDMKTKKTSTRRSIHIALESTNNSANFLRKTKEKK